MPDGVNNALGILCLYHKPHLPEEADLIEFSNRPHSILRQSSKGTAGASAQTQYSEKAGCNPLACSMCVNWDLSLHGTVSPFEMIYGLGNQGVEAWVAPFCHSQWSIGRYCASCPCNPGNFRVRDSSPSKRLTLTRGLPNHKPQPQSRSKPFRLLVPRNKQRSFYLSRR